jgi:hypothetical protein
VGENIGAARPALLVWNLAWLSSAENQQRTGAFVYPPPMSALPITGFNMIAFGLVAAALIISGAIPARRSVLAVEAPGGPAYAGFGLSGASDAC